MSTFNSSLHAQETGNTAAVNANQLRIDYADYLADISADAAGVELDYALTPGQAELVQDFIDEATSRGMPNAETVDLRTRRTGRPAWKNPNGAKFSDFERNRAMKPVWSSQGYRIGKLMVENFAHQPDIIVSEDGLLRVERHPGLFVRSNALGFGTLPKEGSHLPHASVATLGISKNGVNNLDRFSAELAKLIAPTPTHKKSGFI